MSEEDNFKYKKIYKTIEGQQRVFYIKKRKDKKGEEDSSSSNEVDVSNYKGDIRINDEIIKRVESTRQKKKLAEGMELIYEGKKPININTEYEGNYQYKSYKIPIGTTALIKIPKGKGYTYKMLKGGETYKLPKKEPNYFRKLWEGYKKSFKKHPIISTLSLVLNSAMTVLALAVSGGVATPAAMAAFGISMGLTGLNGALTAGVNCYDVSKQINEREKKLIEKEQKILKGRSYDKLSQEEKEKINRINELKNDIRKDRKWNGIKTGIKVTSSLLLAAVPSSRMIGKGFKNIDIFDKTADSIRAFTALQMTRQIANSAYITTAILDAKRKGIKFGAGDIAAFALSYASFAAFSVNHLDYTFSKTREFTIGEHMGVKNEVVPTDIAAFSANYVAATLPLELAINTFWNSREKQKTKVNLIKEIKRRAKKLEKTSGKKFYNRSVFDLKEKELQKYDIGKLESILDFLTIATNDVAKTNEKIKNLQKKALIPEETH
ncbi:MAG: hypothetical protein LBC92_04495, partial [Rickettsiales bacterium]|nr:hypothetical protein [Rickettsiales bacterium]